MAEICDYLRELSIDYSIVIRDRKLEKMDATQP
jgi:hypothetical protein